MKAIVIFAIRTIVTVHRSDKTITYWFHIINSVFCLPRGNAVFFHDHDKIDITLTLPVALSKTRYIFAVQIIRQLSFLIFTIAFFLTYRITILSTAS